jgi:hypothetical protein
MDICHPEVHKPRGVLWSECKPSTAHRSPLLALSIHVPHTAPSCVWEQRGTTVTSTVAHQPQDLPDSRVIGPKRKMPKLPASLSLLLYFISFIFIFYLTSYIYLVLFVILFFYFVIFNSLFFYLPHILFPSFLFLYLTLFFFFFPFLI